MEFDEEIFLWALTHRPAEVHKCKKTFKIDWLNSIVNRAILDRIYTFYEKKGIPPSIDTLKEILKDEFPDTYESRYAKTLNELSNLNPDTSRIIYTLDKVRDVAIVRSLNDLVNSREIVNAAKDVKGSTVLMKIEHWMNQFIYTSDEESAQLKEAVKMLFTDSTKNLKNIKIPCGIDVIDEWTGNGLKPKNLGIIIAPTGHGKSALLLNIAYKIAMREQLPVWFITNELTLAEQTERFLSRVTASSLSSITDDPLFAYDGMGSHWDMTDYIRVTSVNKVLTAKDIEAMMERWYNISSWKPQVLVLDYMERMAPVEKGFSRDKEWSWLQAIASDLVTISKRHNLLIWTAAQTNRAGLNTEEITAEHAQGSIRHLQEAAVVIGAHQKKHEMAETGTAMVFTPLKLRHSKMIKGQKWVDMNLDHMVIYNRFLDEGSQTIEEDDAKELEVPANLKKVKK